MRVGSQADPQPGGAGTPGTGDSSHGAGGGDGALPVESAIFSAYNNGEWLRLCTNVIAVL